MAGAMAGAMAVMIPGASAAFVYVPSDERVSEAHGGDDGSPVAGERAEDVGKAREGGEAAAVPKAGRQGTDARTVRAAGETPQTEAHVAGVWHVRPGETLRGVLGRWGGRAGMEVLFLTDRRYRLHEGRTFAGPFAEAADALFGTLSHLPHPPVGERRSDGGTLAVLHRSRPAGDGK